MSNVIKNFEVGGLSFQGEELFHKKTSSVGFGGLGGSDLSLTLERGAWLVRSSDPEADKNAVIIQTPSGVTRLRTEGDYKREAVDIIGWPRSFLDSVYPAGGLFTAVAVEMAKERGLDKKYRSINDWINSVS